MTATIIITFCILLLLAYLFDISSSKTKIPSIILLLLLGWGVKQITLFLDIHLPTFDYALPVLGTLGLILIVLEGTLELELNKSKKKLILTSFSGSLLGLLFSTLAIAFLFYYAGNYSFLNSLLNAVPFCVISSAIAIPSAKNLNKEEKEFVIYESSFSDILGVIFFSYISTLTYINFKSIGIFTFQIVLMIIISFVSTIGLSYLLSRIKHHIKFIPIILLVILIYEISKIYHLPSLIFVLLFGLTIGNITLFKHIPFINKTFKLEMLIKEIHKFTELTAEVAFLIRSLFFLLFGFTINSSEILNPETMLWAILIVIVIFIIRILQIKLSKKPLTPLLYMAPRGLITILLFISIIPGKQIYWVNKSLVTQVIVLTTFIMMIGVMNVKKTDR